MNKEQIDELYHLLRVASNSDDQDERSTLFGISKHLLAGGDYLSLVQFSRYYGERFLLGPTRDAILKTDWHTDRVVEFGAGLGWLGRGLAAQLGFRPCLFVDKRQWTMIDVIADLETEQGIQKVLSTMKDGDLIVMSDLLHCLEDPKAIMSHFSDWPTAILEYCPIDADRLESYITQIERYGANPLLPTDLVGVFPNRKVDAVDLDPYVLLLVDKEKV